MLIRRLAMLVPLTIAASAAAAPASPQGKSKHGPTAMHTTKVRSKDASEPALAKKVEPKEDAKHAAKPAHEATSTKHDAKDPKGEPKDAKRDAAKDEHPGAKRDGAKDEHPSAKIDPKDARQDPKLAKKDDAKPVAARAPCLRFPVWITRGAEEEFFPLTECDGSDAPGAVEHLSVLSRPESAQKPGAGAAELAKQKGEMLAPGVKRIDERLPHALQLVLDHFDKPGPTRKVHIISGYRPASKGSYHATGQAIDFRIDGVSNEALVSFCKTLSDVGCGYYPNSTFVHMDVRAGGTGHVAWIDASGPGESPRYVSAWPPPPEPTPAADGMSLDKLLEPLPADDHPATTASDAKGDASADTKGDASAEAKGEASL